MAESIFARVKRIVSGNVEDLVDKMEKAGGTTVMKEAIREVERSMDEVKRERDTMTVKRLQIVRQQKLFQERLDQLTEKAEYALSQDREDLAEVALSRQIDFEAQIENLNQSEQVVSEQERALEEAMAGLEMRSERMREELNAFETARAQTGVDIETGESDSIRTERRIERAEAAFNRAMSGAGGSVGVTPGAVQDYKSLAELDQMQRQDKIAERLSQLKKKAS